MHKIFGIESDIFILFCAVVYIKSIDPKNALQVLFSSLVWSRRTWRMRDTTHTGRWPTQKKGIGIGIFGHLNFNTFAWLASWLSLSLSLSCALSLPLAVINSTHCAIKYAAVCSSAIGQLLNWSVAYKSQHSFRRPYIIAQLQFPPSTSSHTPHSSWPTYVPGI